MSNSGRPVLWKIMAGVVVVLPGLALAALSLLYPTVPDSPVPYGETDGIGWLIGAVGMVLIYTGWSLIDAGRRGR